MWEILRSAYQPLVSVIVPITDDAEESGRRIASARAQTWENLEVIPVDMHTPSGFATALSTGVSISKGEFISLLLPGSIYTPDKVARQIAFVEYFDLQDAVIFCDYIITDRSRTQAVPVVLPSVDPAVIFQKLYCGLPIHCSTLLVPRKAMDSFFLPDAQVGEGVLQGGLLALSQHVALVGMTASLVSLEGRISLSCQEKLALRRLYANFLPAMLESHGDQHDADVFSALGDAAVARWEQKLLLAALDNCRASLRLLGRSRGVSRALQSFAKPLLRKALGRLPIGAKRLLRSVRKNVPDTNGPRLDFADIYQNNGFVGTESRSGAGSTRFQTRVIRRELPALLRELGVKSVLDIPCGDFFWMRDVDLAGIRYIGADLVPDMIRDNQTFFGGPLRSFQCVNLISGTLPEADLIFCRDCLVHLPYEDALAALENIRQSKCKWLLTTTFTRTVPNSDLDAAGWRALNLTLPPFNLPPPTVLISEKCTEAGGLAGDKSLGLWRVADLQSSSSRM